MKQLKILLVFISLFLWRWASFESPLPESWTAESRVRFTATILETPEYTDSKTIIRSGIWYIKLKGYKEIIPGSRVSFEGRVAPKMVLGKVVQIKIVEPKVEIGDYKWNTWVMIYQWREKWITVLQKNLPEPMSSLGAGILLGVKGQMPYEFYQQLVKTGTLHIVAASGFNVMIVASVLMQLVQKVFRRGVAIGVGVIGILGYVLIAGASASVVRAGIMGSLTLIAYYFGRPAEARRLLWVTAGIMLLYNPLYIVDIGFQLSVTATAGLLYVQPWLQILKSKILQFSNGGVIDEYLLPTVAATVATMPIILWHFGRVSWISPLVNMLVLPVVPLIMLLTALTLVGGQVVAWVAYVPLAYVVWVIGLFG
jgi:ComEC/Rec2-related protein